MERAFGAPGRRSRWGLRGWILLVAVVLAAAGCVEGDDTADGAETAADGGEGSASDTGDADATDDDEGTGDGAEPVGEAPEEIVIGNPIALSGINNPGAALSQIPSYDLWVEDVNAAGGIYVEEYDTRIPVRIQRVDDTSDVGTAVGQVQQMVDDDSIHFILPPWGTAANFAIAETISEAETPVLGCTVGSRELVENADQYPYFYTMLNQAQEQGTALVELLVELGVETAAVIHHDDLHGIEFAEVVLPQLEDQGIEVVYDEVYPTGAEDLTQTLRAVQDADPQALLAFSYPAETIGMTGQLIGLEYSPDLFFATVGVAFPAYRDIYGPGIEGVFGTGVWNPTVGTDDAQGYFDRHVALHDAEPDRWASAACYASGQVLQQAIEAAGTLDPVAVKEALDTTEFTTILGTFRFENQVNPVYPGQIGQWQDGEFQVVAPAEGRTVDVIHPKAPWPAAE